MTSETNGKGWKRSVQKRGSHGGRYGRSRAIYDQQLRSAEDMWSDQATQNSNPLRAQKGTIAELTTRSYQISKQSIPNVMKYGAEMGRTQEVMSFQEDFNDPGDGGGMGPVLPPDMSAMENAGLANMEHTLPQGILPEWGEEAEVGPSRFDGVRARGGWKTQYAAGRIEASKFNDPRRNNSNLYQLNDSLRAMRKNRAVGGQPTMEEYKAGEYSRRKPQGLAARYDIDTLKSLGSLAPADLEKQLQALGIDTNEYAKYMGVPNSWRKKNLV